MYEKIIENFLESDILYKKKTMPKLTEQIESFLTKYENNIFQALIFLRLEPIFR